MFDFRHDLTKAAAGLTDTAVSRMAAAAVTGVALLMGAAVSWFHEPWFDEAQAWLLAADSDLHGLFWTYLRYEGTPPLWHLLLKMLQALGLPYRSMAALSLLLAAAGAYLGVRHAPFWRLVKLLLPFTYFQFYQYGVVARNYCLLPLGIAAVALGYRRRHDRPLLFLGALAFFANISAHTLLAGVALFGVYGIETLRAAVGRRRWPCRRWFYGSVALGLLVLLEIAWLWIPADIGIEPIAARSTVGSTLWRLAAMADGAMTGFWFLSFPALAAILLLGVSRARLVVGACFALPLVYILGFRYCSAWHQGIVWFFVLGFAWIALESPRRDRRWLAKMAGPEDRPALAAQSALLLAVVIQSTWSAFAGTNDLLAPYTGAKDVADYIKRNRLATGKLWMFGQHCIAIQPYFDQNIFSNYRPQAGGRFWDWSSSNHTPQRFIPAQFQPASLGEDRPDLLVIGIKFFNQVQPYGRLEIPGYRHAGVYPGLILWKYGYYEPDAFVLFRRTAAVADGP